MVECLVSGVARVITATASDRSYELKMTVLIEIKLTYIAKNFLFEITILPLLRLCRYAGRLPSPLPSLHPY